MIGWEAPDSDGGTPIMQYIIEKKDATRQMGTWVLAGTVDADVRKYKVLLQTKRLWALIFISIPH